MSITSALEDAEFAAFASLRDDENDELPGTDDVPSMEPDEEDVGIDITVAGRKQTLKDGRIGHRDPFAHELRAATDFERLQTVWEDATEDIIDSWHGIRDEQIDALIVQIETAVQSGSTTALANIMAPVIGEDLLFERMMEITEDAIVDAKREAKEQGVDIQLIDTVEIEPLVRARAQAVAALMARGISESAARNALLRYGVEAMAAEEVGEAVRAHLEALSDTYLADQLGGAMTQAQNTGRRAVFGQREAEATFYASELLDQSTCPRCKAVDGTKYVTLQDAEQDYPTGGHKECDGGPRCRGTLVAVYDNEAESS